MKVKELINKLKELDQELEVYIPCDSFSEGLMEEITRVQKNTNPSGENSNNKGVWLW